MTTQVDKLGRPVVTLTLKASIDKKLREQTVYHGRDVRAAAVVIEGRVHAAAKINDTWKVAGGGGVLYRNGELGLQGNVEVIAVW